MSRVAAARTPRERAERRVGSTLVKWTLDSLLGIGGMAAVYGATHTKNRSRVALKVLHRELGANSDVRERFMREAYVANSVGHVGALQILDDYVSEDDEPFLVMELLDGSSLDGLQEKRGKLPADEVLRYADQILDVLAAAHAKGIVHRDVKPQNIFVTSDNRVKVLDFGVARILDGAASATVTGSLLGTPAFMPPEQASGRTSAVCAASDLWSVGATMFTLLTGRFVHEAENAQAHTVKAAVAHARSLRSLLPSAPSALVDVVDRALKFEIGDRWPDARRMQNAVQRARKVTVPSVATAEAEEDAETRVASHAMMPGLAAARRRALPNLVQEESQDDDEQTQAMKREGLRALLPPAREAPPSGRETAPSSRREPAAISPEAKAEDAAEEEADGSTTSVIAIRKPPAAPGRLDVATSVVVVPHPSFSETRASRPELPAPPPPSAPDQAHKAPLEIANTEVAAFDSPQGTLPADRTLPFGSDNRLRAAWPDSPGGAAATAPLPPSPGMGPPSPGMGPARQSFSGSFALVPPGGGAAQAGLPPSPTFDLPGPTPSVVAPAPPPEVISVSAQAISQATTAKSKRFRLGTPEMVAVAGALAAILIVAFLVLRALFAGDSTSPATSPTAPVDGDAASPSSETPGLTAGGGPGEAPRDANPTVPSSPATEPTTSAAPEVSASATATSIPTKPGAGQPTPTSRNPGSVRWNPKKPKFSPNKP